MIRSWLENKNIIFALVLYVGLFSGCGKQEVAVDISAKEPGILSDFENIKAWDISPETGFNISLSEEHVTEGKRSLKVVYPIAGLPSINTKKLPSRWGNYDALTFDVFNPQDKKIDFVVRLDDNSRKRVNIDYPLEPGLNNVKISRAKIARSIDPANIHRVVLYLSNANERITLYFDNMRLSSATTNTPLEKKNYKFVDAEICEPQIVVSQLPQKGTMKVYVTKLGDPQKNDILVSNGVPFAPGQLSSEDNFAILDLEGKEIPIAVKVLARWPYDNSVRSILIQFPLEIPHKYKQLFIRWGEPSTASRLEIVKVDWELPEGFIVLPANWLCLSEVVGEEIPMGDKSQYDQNILKFYSAFKDKPLSGDVAKDGYYDTTHVYYQCYVRSGNEEFFKSARKEAINYRNQILQDGPERGIYKNAKQTRYIYTEAMIDDYLLTGDEGSLKVAGYMAEYLKKAYDPSKAFFPKNATHFWTEREAAFPFLGIITYYELTGDKEYLKAAQQIMQNLYKTQGEWPDRGGFIHNLYAHDPEEGARPDEYGGSPFMTGLLLEAIVKYHQLTGSNIAKDSIFRALDWLKTEGLSPDGESFVYTTAEKNREEGAPDLNLLIVHAFGYGYKISGYSRTDYLELGNKVFDCGVKNAYLKDRKHFNQNYRSSGHFLAYITKGGQANE